MAGVTVNSTQSPAKYCNFNSFHKSYKQVHGYASMAVCTCGIAMNTMNILVLTRKEMRSATNLILTGLAVADLLLMLEYVPFAFLFYIAAIPKYTFGMATFVLIHASVSQVFHTISVILTVILALWRYVAIAWPHLMRRWYNLRTTLGVVVCAYIVGFLICTPIYLVYNVQIRVTNNTNVYVMDLSDLAQNNPELETIVVFWVYAVLIKLVPCVLLTCLSLRIVYALVQKEERRRKMCTGSERNRISDRTTRMLLTVLLLFLLTEFPQSVLGFLIAQNGRDFFIQCYGKVADLVDMLTLCNAAINFVLYCCMSRQFRVNFLSVFCRKRNGYLATPGSVYDKTNPHVSSNNHQGNHTQITNL